jgi:hypothetical protein
VTLLHGRVGLIWPWILSGDHPKDETTLLPRCARFLRRDTVEACERPRPRNRSLEGPADTS